MFLVDGRARSIDANRSVLETLYDRVIHTGDGAVWVYRPHPHVAFGPRDTSHERYEEAVAFAQERGYPTVERSVGGHPVAHTGATLVFLRAIPIDDPRHGLHERYEDVCSRLAGGLADLGVTTHRGEPPGSFCPGEHSLSADGKLVGIAQRVKSDLAVVSGIVVVDDAQSIAAILEPIYAMLDLDFDPTSVGSIVDAGGPTDIETVRTRLSRVLYDDTNPRTLPVSNLLSQAE